MVHRDPHQRYSVDFFCGLSSAVITTLVTHPVNKLIYRQILEGGALKDSLTRLRQEGPRYLYRGALPPMFHKSVSLSTMFGVYNVAILPMKKLHIGEHKEQVGASFIAGTVETVFCPFERVQVLLVRPEFHDRFKNTFHAFVDLKRSFGVAEYFRGVTILFWRNTLSNSTFFILKSELQKYVDKDDAAITKNFRNFVTGGCLGMFMSTTMYPLKVIKVQIQKDIGGRFLTFREVVTDIYKTGGVRRFYKGAVLNGTRALLSWGVTNMVFEYMKDKIG